MFELVFLSLLVMTVVCGVVGVAMFLDVAFAGSGGVAPATGTPRSARVFGRFVGPSASRKEKVAETAVCDAACHDREILVTTPEALAIVRELRSRFSPAEVNAIRGKVEGNLSQLGGTRQCPLLLSSGFCACEGARPVSCRTRCIVGADSDVEAQKLAETVGADAIHAFRDYLHATGLDDGEYELNRAILAALDTTEAARRWTHGEHVLDNATSKTA